MYEVRFHGRGGQGAVTAANILAVAGFKSGMDVQSFPMFGVERRGAPVAAFTRMDDKKIDIRNQIYEPDCVVVLDTTLLDVVDVSRGLKENGILIINTRKDPSDFKFDVPGVKIFTVNATDIAVNNRLGTRMSPIVNTAVLGAFARATGIIDMKHIEVAIDENAPIKTEENKQAARDAYNGTTGGA